jgi:hypothetical protein
MRRPCPNVCSVSRGESNICLRPPTPGDSVRPTEQEGSHGV